jgi:flagellin-like protein
MTMARKAISPMIALVIMIAIVVTLGGMITSWLSGFVSESSQHDTCAIDTVYTLSDASYNASSGQIRVKVKNSGKEDLYNFTVEADNGTLIAIIPVTSPAQTYHLRSGRSQYILANSSAYNITNIATITVITGSCTGYSPSPVNI